MTEILDQVYFGNTLLNWVSAMGVIVLSALLGRIVYWLFSSVIRVFTRRTKTELDDIVIDMIEEPLVFLLIASGIWFGLSLLVLPTVVGDTVASAYQILFALLVGWMLSRLFGAICDKYLVPFAERTENDLDDLLLPILRRGINLIIWSMAIIVGLNNAGYNVGALIAGLGIGGLALAMAARDTVSNVFGGFTIFTDQPFKINDRIKVSGYDGMVSEIGVRSTRLRTLEGREVTIPNAKFADAPVENVSREPSRKVIVALGLTYDTAPDQMQKALDLLRKIAEENSDVEESVTVFFSSFGDFSLNITFIYYICSGSSIADTQNAVNMAILREFNTEGLEFAFPTQTIYSLQGTTA